MARFPFHRSLAMNRSIALIMLACSPSLFAAEPPKAAPAEGLRFEGKFADGSFVVLQLMDEVLIVSTKYGKLTVPMAEVKRIEFGFRYPEGLEATDAHLFVKPSIAEVFGPATGGRPVGTHNQKKIGSNHTAQVPCRTPQRADAPLGEFTHTPFLLEHPRPSIPGCTRRVPLSPLRPLNNGRGVPSSNRC